MKKHDFIGFNDYPGFIKSFFIGLQYMMVPYIALVLLIIVLKSVNTSPAVIETTVSITILISMCYALLQAFKVGPFGCRMLLPSSLSTHFFPQCLLAIKSGGLSLICGMSMFSGALEFIFSYLLKYIKKVFPIIIADMVILIVAVELALIGSHELIDFFPIKQSLRHPDWLNYSIDFATLVMLMMLEKYGPKGIKFFNIITVVLIMYPAVYFFGYMKASTITNIAGTSWLKFNVPKLHAPSFSWHLAGAYVIGTLVSVVKITGSTTTLLQVNRLPMDLKRSSGAIATSGLFNFISGIVGTMPINISSSGVGLSVSTRMTARVVALFMAPVYLITAFSPKLSSLLIYMPRPITGGILIYIGSSLFMTSAKQIIQNCDKLETKLMIGIPLVLGFTYHTYPNIFKTLPNYINAFTGSSLVIATLFAVFLNLVFKSLSLSKKRRKKFSG